MLLKSIQLMIATLDFIIFLANAEVIFFGDCKCDQDFCSAIAEADAFLFPFVVEFSLVASCLLYVTWRNVGKLPHICQHIIKPTYKFYKSYKGDV